MGIQSVSTKLGGLILGEHVADSLLSCPFNFYVIAELRRTVLETVSLVNGPLDRT